MFFLIRMLLRYPKLILLLGGIVMLGFGLKGVVEDASNPYAKPITISQFETQQPSSGWYHITGGQLDLAQATVTNKDSGSVVVAPLLGPHDANGALPTVFVKTSNPTLVAQAGTQGAFPAVDISGMIEERSNNGSTMGSSGSSSDTEGLGLVVDDGRKPGSLLEALGLLIAGLATAALGVAMMTGMQIPFLDGKGYEWSAENYQEKPSTNYPQSNRGPAYPPAGYPQQGAYPAPPNYPQQQAPGAYPTPLPPHLQQGPGPSGDSAPPKMRTLE
jgi:hypothetical protein